MAAEFTITLNLGSSNFGEKRYSERLEIVRMLREIEQLVGSTNQTSGSVKGGPPSYTVSGSWAYSPINTL